MKRIIISDIHIGSKSYCGKELIHFLRNIEYDQLILAGDIIDFIKIPSFTKNAIDIFEAIDYSKDIVYIVGNHDISFSKIVGQDFFGVKFLSHYEFKEGDRTFRIEHGDRYETGIVQSRFWMNIVSVLHDFLERRFNLNVTSWFINYKIKKRKLIRIWDIMKRNNDVDVLVMGHSHCPEAIIWVDKNEDIKTYVNCGDWVSNRTWVSITDGVVRLRTQKLDSLS
jgi:UDP-2,3-diacylglucosamine pyrophosphatase LpxH|tara:strand:- start:3800 stop:4471 length:672 start_codon:yes stop_codon:yes gene_type:complete